MGDIGISVKDVKVLRAAVRDANRAVRRIEARSRFPLSVGGGAPMSCFRIVCNGPEGEAPPTTNAYWMQASRLVEMADPDDPDEPPVTELKEGDVVLGVNLAEQLAGSHGLRVGEEVMARKQGDSGGASRWVFLG